MSIKQKDSWLYGTHFHALQHEVEVLTPETDKFIQVIEARQALHKKVQVNTKLIVRFNRFCERLKRVHNENEIYQMFVWG